MDFRISGLPVEPFIPFFAMSDAELLAHGARRAVARAEDAPLMHPCRFQQLTARSFPRSGKVLILFAVLLPAMLAVTGLIIDG